MPGSCSMENTSSSAAAPAEPRTEREQSSSQALVTVSGDHSDTRRSSRDSPLSGEPSMVFHTLAHGSPHSQTAPALQLPQQFVWCRAGPSSGGGSLAWPVSGPIISSTLPCRWQNHSWQLLSLASVILQMLLAYPSYLYRLPYSRQETELNPLSWEGWLSFDGARFHLRKLHADSKISILERCVYPLRNKAGLSLTTRHILVHLKFLPSVLLAGV